MDAFFHLLGARAPGTLPLPPSGGQRAGVVRAVGRAVADDTGEFYPLGLTFMWSLQGVKYEWEHYTANVTWAAAKGFDFTRPLTEVAWEGTRRIDPTQPEWSDWHEVLRRHIDFAYNCGVRSGITLRGKGTTVDPLWLAREVAGVIADGRTHKVLCCEMENEYWNGGDPLDELVAMAQEIHPRIPTLLSLSAPANEEAAVAEVTAAAQYAGVAIFNRHTERADGDYGWRNVRQAWDFHNDRAFVAADWEGPGPGSSGAEMTQPLQIAMKRAIAAMCGAPIFILHTGTGVYGDGKPSSSGVPRPPNFWEIANIDAIVAALRGLDVLLPAGLPNWTTANTQWVPPNPVAPFQPHDHWEGDHGDGVNKAYAALAPDGRVIQMPCGVRGHAKMTASYPLREVTVYDPLTRLAVPGFEGRSFNQGESMDLPGGGLEAMVAYIIHGRRA